MTDKDCSNIITPPDIVDSNSGSTVLLIDPTQSEIEDVAFFLKTAKDTYNVYVYCETMNNKGWVHDVLTKATAIVINTTPNTNSSFKDRLATSAGDIYHYGEKNFLMARDRQLKSPVEYFINHSFKGK